MVMVKAVKASVRIRVTSGIWNVFRADIIHQTTKQPFGKTSRGKTLFRLRSR
jgi:hypothetical protein